MLGKDTIRASQRVDYSGYGDDEENVVYEDNVIPHKQLPLRVSNMIFNNDIDILTEVILNYDYCFLDAGKCPSKRSNSNGEPC